MVPVPVAAGLSLDGHDLAVQPFGPAVGDPVTAEGQDVFQVPSGQLPHLAHRGQS